MNAPLATVGGAQIAALSALWPLRPALAGVKYRNERMFGVSDVHADTVNTYKFIGSEINRGAQKIRRDAEEAIKKGKGFGGGGEAAAPSPQAPSGTSPPLSPLRAGGSGGALSPAASPRSQASLAAAADSATKRGHTTAARLLAEREAAAAAAEKGEFGPDSDDEGEGSALLI